MVGHAAADVEAAFTEAMAAVGLCPKGGARADGRMHRFPIGNGYNKNGFYVLHADGAVPAGMYGDWKSGLKETWKFNGGTLSDFDRAELVRKVEADRKRREREQTKRHKDAADSAAILWNSYKPAPAEHPYLTRKGVSPHGACVDPHGNLVISLNDVDGAIWSLETIGPDGDKRFMPGGRKRGLFFAIGEPGDQIVVAEGFATAATIHEATGFCTVVAFDAGNLEPVARALRERRPDARIVIAADDDRDTHEPIENPGVTYAARAAQAVNGILVVPAFIDTAAGTDFNDLAQAEGLDRVTDQIMPAFEVEELLEVEPDDEGQEAAPVDDWQALLAEQIAWMNERYFVAAIGGKTLICSLVEDAATGKPRLVFSRETDIKLMFAHRHYKVGESQKGRDIVKGLGDAWLNDWRRRTYRKLDLITEGECPPDVYNLWRGYGVEPEPAPWPRIAEHLRDVLCGGNDSYYAWLLGWCAYCVQNPGRQAEVAVVLRGGKGVGKGAFGRLMMRLFSTHALHITHSKHLVGSFNAHLVDCLFLFADEAFWAGDKAGEGALKALVTESTVQIEPKGVDSFAVRNRVKILISSNEDWVVPVSADERRFFVLDIEGKRDRAYFKALFDAIEGQELSGFLAHLLAIDLSAFDHRNPPHTEGLNRQKLIGANSVVKFWHDCLWHGEIVGTPIDDWPGNVVVQVLHAAYVEWAQAHGDRYPVDDIRMAKELDEMMPAGHPLKIIRPRECYGETSRPRRYVLPPLADARAAFLASMHVTTAYDWPVVEVER